MADDKWNAQNTNFYNVTIVKQGYFIDMLILSAFGYHKCVCLCVNTWANWLHVRKNVRIMLFLICYLIKLTFEKLTS